MISSYPVRKSLHLNDYDYGRNGLYFITICTQNRSCLLGQISDNKMQLNDVGLMIENGWNNLPIRYPSMSLDAFVVMPNHIHGILKIDPCLVGESLAGSRSDSFKIHSLHEVIGGFKSITAVQYTRNISHQRELSAGWKLWQRGYYDHIIRDETELDRIRDYITNNPAQWEKDDQFEREPARDSPTLL
jgi:REP element-mobilizing transposase RayT